MDMQTTKIRRVMIIQTNGNKERRQLSSIPETVLHSQLSTTGWVWIIYTAKDKGAMAYMTLLNAGRRMFHCFTHMKRATDKGNTKPLYAIA